jgi:hypothetical protein
MHQVITHEIRSWQTETLLGRFKGTLIPREGEVVLILRANGQKIPHRVLRVQYDIQVNLELEARVYVDADE